MYIREENSIWFFFTLGKKESSQMYDKKKKFIPREFVIVIPTCAMYHHQISKIRGRSDTLFGLLLFVYFLVTKEN